LPFSKYAVKAIAHTIPENRHLGKANWRQRGAYDLTKNQLADILRADSLQGGMAMAIKAGNHPEQVTLSAIKAYVGGGACQR